MSKTEKTNAPKCATARKQNKKKKRINTYLVISASIVSVGGINFSYFLMKSSLFVSQISLNGSHIFK